MMRRKKEGTAPAAGKKQDIYVNIGPVEKRVAIVENERLVDYFMEREGLEHYVGSIFVGKVSSVVKGIEAAFVEIGMEKNGFLHLGDIIDSDWVFKELMPEGDEPLAKEPSSGAPNDKKERDDGHRSRRNPKGFEPVKQGQKLLVQVVKEAISTKGPRLTTHISIPGRYVILVPFDNNVGVSRRIEDRDLRKQIREYISDFKLPEGVGCIVRTMAENITKEEIHDELRYLLNIWKMIQKRVETQNTPGVVYEEYGTVLRMVRDKFTDDVEKLVVDSREEHQRILNFLKYFRPALRAKVKLYDGKTPLFQKYDLEHQVDEIFERKINLKSGGSIFVEQTEGLVAIDVNTGKFTGKKNLEETAYKTNLEAAEEIPRQLLLRDIGGIIIIDFIDMESKAHRDNVFNRLQDELKRDKARISLRAISTFGIVEMTRQRMRKSLESASHIECPVCHGKGVVKSSDTIAIEAVRKIEHVLSSMIIAPFGRKHIEVIVHPEISDVLVSDQAKMMSDIQRKYRCKIDLREEKAMNREEVIINKK
ncbi:MAG: Rne/Rng family ribonuclease [Candidatus Omnitrophica bacterium]|nr:Rne/Rng family ribonuclease [Candidatus Omnitrophota bacterium]